jgi:hypothetical protein
MPLRSPPVWVAVSALLLLASLAGIWAARTAGHAMALRDRLDELEALAAQGAQGMDLDHAADLARGLHREILSLYGDLRPLLRLAPYLGWVPGYGGDLEAAPYLFEIGLALSQAGEGVVAAFGPLLDGAEGGASMQIAFQALVEAAPELQRARQLLQQAVEARANIEPQRLSPRLAGYLSKLDALLPWAQVGVDAALLAPDLLGKDGRRTYLIVAQNEDELRATGGFITAAGLLSIEQGRIVELSFMDSYAVDDLSQTYPEPPQPIMDFMLAEQWLFRDSNWSADFPSAAQEMAASFRMGTGREVDGVIAVDSTMLAYLVEATGPLYLEGTDEAITAANVVPWMRAARGAPPEGQSMMPWWESRKDFMTPLARAIRERLESGQVDPIALAKALMKGLNEKHLLAHLFSSEAQELLRQMGWSGEMVEVQGDYLYVVDSNLGFNKVNPLVDQELNYRVTLGPEGSGHSHLEVVYTNHSKPSAEGCNPLPRYGAGYEEEMQRCYWNYLRVYVPSGARLLEASPAPLPQASLRALRLGGAGEETLTVEASQKGKQVFGMYLLVPRGQSHTQILDYRLPQVAFEAAGGIWTYRLLVQKQPGARMWPLRVTLVLPPGARLLDAQPHPAKQSAGDLTFELSLNRDQELRVQYELKE